MKRIATLACALTAAAGVLDAGRVRPQSVFRTDTQAVTVDISVRVKNRPVAGLSADDFLVSDNGVPQRVVLFAASDLPVDVTVIFGENSDAAIFLADKYDGIIQRMLSFLRPEDRVAIVTAATEVRQVVALQPVAGLTAPRAIENLHLGDAREGQTRLDVDTDPARLHSDRDAMLLALARPADARRRRMIVAFTSIGDPENFFGSILRQPTMKRILERADVPIHMVGLPPQMVRDERGMVIGMLGGVSLERKIKDFASLAALTGGDSRSTKDNVGAFKSIIENYRQSYVLQYTATGVPATGWHTIEVKVPKCPTCEVLARKGYAGQ